MTHTPCEKCSYTRRHYYGYCKLRIFFSRPRREKSPLDDSTNDSIDDHEEEFYYTEVELGAASSPPTLSHRDMARPPHEGKGCAASRNTIIIIRTVLF